MCSLWGKHSAGPRARRNIPDPDTTPGSWPDVDIDFYFRYFLSLLYNRISEEPMEQILPVAGWSGALAQANCAGCMQLIRC